MDMCVCASLMMITSRKDAIEEKRLRELEAMATAKE